jgi:hypothetical protein
LADATRSENFLRSTSVTLADHDVIDDQPTGQSNLGGAAQTALAHRLETEQLQTGRLTPKCSPGSLAMAASERHINSLGGLDFRFRAV